MGSERYKKQQKTNQYESYYDVGDNGAMCDGKGTRRSSSALLVEPSGSRRSRLEGGTEDGEGRERAPKRRASDWRDSKLSVWLSLLSFCPFNGWHRHEETYRRAKNCASHFFCPPTDRPRRSIVIMTLDAMFSMRLAASPLSLFWFRALHPLRFLRFERSITTA